MRHKKLPCTIGLANLLSLYELHLSKVWFILSCGRISRIHGFPRNKFFQMFWNAKWVFRLDILTGANHDWYVGPICT